ncbi:hypothetical protein F0562_003234 [Nyssa sinensis]|uniref:Uncharacterized protein n=1 Tax=Nyssa sinensis TaxID=561372 RepID=A0A5J5BYY5_9ASTE|nr:hypothetical protein F0562_003234 [Nyssa sinensis]
MVGESPPSPWEDFQSNWKILVVIGIYLVTAIVVQPADQFADLLALSGAIAAKLNTSTAHVPQNPTLFMANPGPTCSEQNPDALDPITIAKLQCVAGLAQLEAKEYRLAAWKFLEMGHELGNNYTEEIAPQDVATTVWRSSSLPCLSFQHHWGILGNGRIRSYYLLGNL